MIERIIIKDDGHKKDVLEAVDKLFIELRSKPEKYSVLELGGMLDAVTPTHALAKIDDTITVDALLSIYSFIYSKAAPIYGYYAYLVRDSDRNEAARYRSYRDYMEVYMKSVRLLYDSLSRRLTVFFGKE